MKKERKKSRLQRMKRYGCSKRHRSSRHLCTGKREKVVCKEKGILMVKELMA